MRTIDVLRRQSGERLYRRTGYLLATGAFVFQEDAQWKILTHAELDGFRGLAGDPRIVSGGDYDGHILMSFATSEDTAPEAIVFYDGFFNKRLAKPKASAPAGLYPLITVKLWRHRSDDLTASATLSNVDVISTAGNLHIPIALNGSDVHFEWAAVNPGSGLEGVWSNALDTYFGGAIGLKDGVYIGARRYNAGQSDDVVANWWDGVTLTPIGQPDVGFFTDMFGNLGSVFSWVSYRLNDARPLCRYSDNAALCVGTATVNCEALMRFNAYQGFPWWMHYCFSRYGTATGAVNDVALLSTGSYRFQPTVPDAGIVDRTTGDLRLSAKFVGSANCVFSNGPLGYSAPYATGMAGMFDIGMMTRNGVSIAPYIEPFYTNGPFVMAKRKNGPYEMWLVDDPFLPEFTDNPDYEQFRMISQNYNNQFWFRRISYREYPTTPGGAPYPSDGVQYDKQDVVVAAAMHNGGIFVMSRADPEQANLGMLGNTHPSPFGLNQQTPRSAGPLLFAGSKISSNNGDTWIESGISFGSLTASAGERTIPWTFHLKKAQLEDAITL